MKGKQSKRLMLCCAVLSCSVMFDFVTPMDCSPQGSSVHEDSPGNNARVGCHALLWGRDLRDNIKCTNIHIIGLPEEEEREKGPEKIFEDNS